MNFAAFYKFLFLLRARSKFYKILLRLWLILTTFCEAKFPLFQLIDNTCVRGRFLKLPLWKWTFD